MRTRRLTATLLAACLLSGCGKKEPPARPGAMLPRPGDIAAPTAPTIRPADGKTPGRVVAAGMLQVGQRFITIEDAMSRGQFDFGRLNANLPVEQFRAKAAPVVDNIINLLIRDTLALGEAEREMTDKQKRIVDAKVQYAKSQWITDAGGSAEQLRHKLAARGLDLKQVLDNERRQLMVRDYHEQKFLLSIVITRKMMWQYYTANRDKYISNRKVRLRVIAVPMAALWPLGVTDPTDEQRVAAEAQSLKIVREAEKAISGGEDFKSVARRVGKNIQGRYGKEWEKYDFWGKSRIDLMVDKGGLWPDERSPESFSDEVLARAARLLKQGQVGKVEQTDRCCYLVQADHVIPARSLSFGDAQENIMGLLRQEEYRLRENRHLRTKRAEFERQLTGEDRKRGVRFAQMVLDRVAAEYRGK